MWFKKLFKAIVSLLKRPEAKKILDTWERVFDEQRSALLVEMAIKAKPMISTLMDNNKMSGSQKRDFVVSELVSIFKNNSTALKVKLADATLKDLALLATQQQFVAERLDK